MDQTMHNVIFSHFQLLFWFQFGYVEGTHVQYGGVYFVFLRQEGFRQPPRKHFVIHGKSMENRSMENPWKIEWKNQGKTMENSMGNPWEING